MYFCVLYIVLFWFRYSYIAVLHLHLWWFYCNSGCENETWPVGDSQKHMTPPLTVNCVVRRRKFSQLLVFLRAVAESASQVLTLRTSCELRHKFLATAEPCVTTHKWKFQFCAASPAAAALARELNRNQPSQQQAPVYRQFIATWQQWHVYKYNYTNTDI